jgi:hypothetical protein
MHSKFTAAQRGLVSALEAEPTQRDLLPGSLRSKKAHLLHGRGGLRDGAATSHETDAGCPRRLLTRPQ